ncbi:hypothetical protein BGY98DRAFT_1099536 [Russula aff. rugulosa BPL654]|nr:hypothetical protein BGY98DRAFT_1099536 [Russula aff. rugulosa BPL654]
MVHSRHNATLHRISQHYVSDMVTIWKIAREGARAIGKITLANTTAPLIKLIESLNATEHEHLQMENLTQYYFATFSIVLLGILYSNLAPPPPGAVVTAAST